MKKFIFVVVLSCGFLGINSAFAAKKSNCEPRLRTRAVDVNERFSVFLERVDIQGNAVFEGGWSEAVDSEQIGNSSAPTFDEGYYGNDDRNGGSGRF